MAGWLWALIATVAIPFPTSKNPICFYSSHTRDDLTRLYLHAIRRAQRSLSLSIYSLTDPYLIQALKQSAKEGKKISIFYDRKASTLPKGLLKRCQALPYHGSGLMHRKLLVIDEKWTLIGSANLTPTSLKSHDNFVVALKSKELAKSILLQASSPKALLPPSQEVALWLLPSDAEIALQTLVHSIASAKKEIRLALFTLTHPILIDALTAAHQRGVKIWCALDRYTAEGASKEAALRLKAAGVPVWISRGEQLLHHKWALIDRHTLFFGSANWTQAAFSKNRECLMRLEPLSRKQRKFIKKMVDAIQCDSQPLTVFSPC